MLIVGLSLLIYPTVSDYLNNITYTRVLQVYRGELELISNDDYDELIERAHEYNRELLSNRRRFRKTADELQEYHNVLGFAVGGVIGSLEIDAINVNLPIFVGTDDRVLQTGVGHLEGSSLPIGGEGTHSILTGHRGNPSSLLLSNADRLVEGDIFVLRMLRESLYYQIERVAIVEPDDFTLVRIDPYRDLSTLLTCTPYGINSHRLLLIRHRIFPEYEEVIVTHRVTAGAVRLNRAVGFAFSAIPLLFIWAVFSIVRSAAARGQQPEFRSRNKKHYQLDVL